MFFIPLSIGQPIEGSRGHCEKFDKITQWLIGVRTFVVENIKGIIDIISQSYEVLENVKRNGNHL